MGFGSGTTPRNNDTIHNLLYKLVEATNNIGSISISGVTGTYSWDGTGAMPLATGAATCWGEFGSAVDGKEWKKTTPGTSATDWKLVME